jgi:hypothetical protein
MNWVSFSLGFLAFPVVVAAAMGIYLAVTRALQRDANLSRLAVSQRSAALGFSPRLIGEIGEEDQATETDYAAQERAAKAS